MTSTAYLSTEGIASVRAELERLTTVDRPEVVARIVAARELGDLRENAEYETARKDQSILEGRIEHLSALLRDAVTIEGSSTTNVTLGTAVTVEDDLGQETYTIVMAASAAPRPSAGRSWVAGPATRSRSPRRAARSGCGSSPWPDRVGGAARRPMGERAAIGALADGPDALRAEACILRPSGGGTGAGWAPTGAASPYGRQPSRRANGEPDPSQAGHACARGGFSCR